MARYEGPVVYVCFDHYEKRPWWRGGGVVQTQKAGWHYSTRIDKNGHEIPDKPLYLNTDNKDDPFYEFARDEHDSWADRHGPGNTVWLEG